MKTAEEWKKVFKWNQIANGYYTDLEIQQIQLDAIKHGMTLAAEKVRLNVEDAYKGTTHMNEYGHGVKKGMLESASLILIARDNLKELP